jgi:prophage antirepressor-like protein
MNNNYAIKKFTRPEFGALTTIKNDSTGVIMFVGQEIANIWGHTNLTRAIQTSHLNPEEFKVIDLKPFPLFKKQLTNSQLVGHRSSSITLLTESGMYKLALASNLEKAKPFRDWVTQEVLPSIRKTGQYILLNQYDKLAVHKNVNVQKSNSREVNAKNYTEKGLDAAIEYNRESCLLHCGKTPSQLKELGRKMGLKAKETSSGKEVLRHIKPAVAAAMSFSDSLVKQGFALSTVAPISVKGIPLFEGLIEIGVKPEHL